jgi:nitroreductase
MNMQELVRTTRSYRRFQESHRIGMDVLEGLVDLARQTASGRNLQPLKYMPCNDPALNARIYPELAWAGYLPEWDGPEPGERPAAYLVVLGDLNLTKEFGVDPGIVCQTILLGAAEKGLGGCIIGAIKRERLKQVLGLPEHLAIVLVVALGKPVEEVRLEPMPADGSVKYWRDTQGVHHVPKRSLAEVLVAAPER